MSGPEDTALAVPDDVPVNGVPPDATRILHLEDSPIDAELVAEYLRATELPIQLDRVSTQEGFTAAVERGVYDLILADYALPGFDGVQALAIARETCPNTPFIFVSGVLGEDNAVESLKQGATDYVVKQRLSKLPMAVMRALAEARERDERERIARELQTSYRSLRDTEDRLRMLMASTASMMWNADAVGRFTNRQPGFEELTGGRFEAYRGWTWLNFIHPEDRDRMRAAWRVAAVDRSLLEIEHRVRFRDGTWRHVLTRGVPILGPEEDGEPGRLMSWIGTSSDIEMRKQAEIELQRLNETLERRVGDRTTALAEANRQLLRQIEERARAEEALRHAQKMEAVGQLTGGVAHDFNNLLTVVMGGLDLILRQVTREGVPPQPERIKFAAENAMQGARRAATLTHRLLAFSRRQSLNPRPIDANRLVSGMSEMLQRTLGESIALRVALSTGLWVTEADPNQLENALLNLAVNARDAMPEGGQLSIGTRNVTIDSTNAAAMNGSFVEITVVDTGTGMDEATLAHAFEPFFTTKDVGQGTGLGLSQVYGFVRQSAGHVRLESRPGHGTIVRIYLPRRDGVARPAHPPAAVHAGPVRGDGQTVLVVEDDAAVREYSTHCMRELGFTVLEAPGGAAGLALLDQHPEVALLFTDIGLPGGMNGRQLAEAALARRPDLKVLFTSGYALQAFSDETPADGALHLLAKPFTAADLAVKLQEVIGSR